MRTLSDEDRELNRMGANYALGKWKLGDCPVCNGAFCVHTFKRVQICTRCGAGKKKLRKAIEMAKSVDEKMKENRLKPGERMVDR